MSTPTWARSMAQRFLAYELPRRWTHVQAVAHRATEVGHVAQTWDREILIAAAWLHDIGYAKPLVKSGFHPLDGARFLAATGAPRRVCALVAHHSAAAAVAHELGLATELAAFEDERTLVRDALWYCDMTVGPAGEPLSYEQRIAEIRARRGPDDPVVRALDTGEREAAVRRIRHLLQHEPILMTC